MELLLFTTDGVLARRAEAAGIDSVVVDWETRGKDTRQKGYALETNRNDPADVARLSALLGIPVTVRINPPGEQMPREIECALDSGARILMLPMASSPGEVGEFLRAVDGRARTIVQIETTGLVEQAEELRALEWDYAYIGLNDLMVARRNRSIWESLLDGTAESVCRRLEGRAYGFGGATILGGGEPVVNIFILHELVRLGGSLSIMRRTFRKELLDRDIEAEIRALRSFIDCSRRRGERAREYDRVHLGRILRDTAGAAKEPPREKEFIFEV